MNSILDTRPALRAVIDEVAEVTGARGAVARGKDHLAAALEHVAAHVVEIRAGHAAGASADDVVGRVDTVAAGAMGAEQVIPAVLVHEGRGLAVDAAIDALHRISELEHLRQLLLQTWATKLE